MRHPDGTYDLTIDDIHEIRIKNYELIKDMSNEERVAYINRKGSEANRERVIKLGVDKFIDYKKENYVDSLSNVDYVLDTLGERELNNEFKILKNGGKLVSLKAIPNSEFAERMEMPFIKKLLFSIAGRKYDNLAKKNNQKYYFIFVREDGKGLNKISEIFDKEKITPSVDEVFSLYDINKALDKVKNGKSIGKTVIRVG